MSVIAPAWAEAPASVALPQGSVHVWLAFCEPDAPTATFERVLAADELSRAQRFVFARDRRRYVTAHRLLRQLLGGYLGVAPADVQFTYGEHGKPALTDTHARRVDFNMSHSGEAVVIAVSAAGPVGVDIEALRVMRDRDDVAQRTFAAGEFARLCGVDDEQRTEAFFNCWTRKEAFVKAIGDGLSHPLERFEVTLEPGAPARLVHIDGDVSRAAAWTIGVLPHVPGFATALAVNGAVTVSCFRWREEPVAASMAAADERCMA